MKGFYRPLQVPAPAHRAAPFKGKWYTDGPPVSVPQGWKLYVSASLPHYLETLAITREVFARHGVPSKYACSDKVFRKLNAGLYGYCQVGKNIVGYFAEDAALRSVAAELKDRLRAFADTAPQVPFAQPLGGELPLSYRYGAFHGDTIELAGEDYADDRRKPARWIFDHIPDPLSVLSEDTETDEAFDAFLSRYPVYETLSQGGKGGIFAAFDLEADAFNDLILKIGYRKGQVLPDGRDGMALLKREADFFALLDERRIATVAPALVDYRQFRDRNVLIMERIDGQNLQTLRIDGALTRGHVEKCLAVLDTIHGAGLYVGDAKIANFVEETASAKIYAIDFEAAGRLDTAKLDILCTYHFSRPTFGDMAKLERCHLLYSALHVDDETTFSESDRIIDLPQKLAQITPSDETGKWALGLLQAELLDIEVDVG